MIRCIDLLVKSPPEMGEAACEFDFFEPDGALVKQMCGLGFEDVGVAFRCSGGLRQVLRSLLPPR